jgi:hypothetical protein
MLYFPSDLLFIMPSSHAAPKLKRPDLPILVISLIVLSVAVMILSGVKNKTYRLINKQVVKESAFISFAALVIYGYIIAGRKEPISGTGAALFAGTGFIGHMLFEISGVNSLFF